MRIWRSHLVFVMVLALLVAACGGSGGEGESESGTTVTTVPDESATTVPSTESTQTTAESGGESPAPEVGEQGGFTVNDTEFAVTLLNRCIPFSDEPGNIDLQALAQAQGAKLNLILMGGTTDVSVDGSGIEEMFGSLAFGQDAVVESWEVSGDRWTGAATVTDSLGSGETVDITWDVMVPAEVRDCSL